ncbi:MAG: type II toxin-antitoxin system VapC family toxin [Isosphaeraceae bacterium]|nr:type II toxin-antitoxin system VapC family toxin [Isosphaeraceae bacterium]
MLSISRLRKDLDASFVLDGSIALSWTFEDESNQYAESVLDSLAEHRAIVTPIWRLEVSNALIVGERRKRMTESRSTRWVEVLSALPIYVELDDDDRICKDILQTARFHGLTAYDASYLELAIRRGLPIATLDHDLKRAAIAAGIAAFGHE